MLFIVLPMICLGQAKKGTNNSNAPISQVISRDALQFKMDVLTRAEFRDIAEIEENFKRETNNLKTPAIIRKSKVKLSEFIVSMKGSGESSNIFANGEGSGLGIYSFNNQNALLFSGLIYNYSLNTLQLDADQRASKVAKEVLLPCLRNFEELLTIPEINYFSLLCGYIARDFSKDENSVAYKDGETLAIVIPKSVLKKYINAEITDEDVFKLATFYNSNKSISGIKKISIK